MISDSLKKTLFEMAFGFVIYEGILAIVLLIISKIMRYSPVSLFLGYITGIILAIYILLDMAVTIENVIDLKDPDYARKKTMLHAGIRKAVLIAVIIIALNLKFINTMAIVLTLFGIKAGAYLQPYANKIYKNKTGKSTQDNRL